MKFIDKWKPSKYRYENGCVLPSDDPNELCIASRMIASLVAEHYSIAIPKLCRGKLLGLGCGKAPLYEAYKSYVNKVELADWQNSLHINPCIDHVIDLSKSIPLPDDSYDTIILSDVLEHIPNPDHLMREISRILSKNGILILNVPFYYWIHEEPYDYYRYTQYGLQALCEQAGLSLESVVPLGGVLEVISDIIGKSVACSKLPGKNILIFCIDFGVNYFRKTRIGNRISKRTSQFFPLGYFAEIRK